MLIDNPTARAGLRRGKEAVDFFAMATIPSPFILDKGDELRPPGIRDGLRQFAIFDHALDVQVLKGDDAVLSHQSFAQFVVKVLALVGYPFKQSGDLEALLLPIGRPLGLARKPTLRSGKSFLSLSQMFGIVYLFAGTEGRKVFETQVDADMSAVIARFVYLHLTLYRDVVLTALGFRDGTVFHLAFDGPVEDSLDPADFGQIDFRPFNLEALRVADRLFGSLRFEFGVLGSTFKKVGVGCIQVYQFLLKYLTISLPQPLSLRFFLEGLQLIDSLVFAQALARLLVMRLAQITLGVGMAGASIGIWLEMLRGEGL